MYCPVSQGCPASSFAGFLLYSVLRFVLGVGNRIPSSQPSRPRTELLLPCFLSHMPTLVSYPCCSPPCSPGYGLDLASEMKMLRVIHNVGARHAASVCSTYCGAHAIPEGSTAEAMVEDVLTVQLPEVIVGSNVLPSWPHRLFLSSSDCRLTVLGFLR